MGAIEFLNAPKSVTRAGTGGTVSARGTADGALATLPWYDMLTVEGRAYGCSASAAGTLLLGQTSFANTTPMLLLSVPSGVTAIPAYLSLVQATPVAGAALDVIVEYDDAARWSSGGTAETIMNLRTDNPRTAQCTLRSNPTAASGYGVRAWGATIGQDISPAEGAVNGTFLNVKNGTLPFALLVGSGASWLVFAYAATTAPTFFWEIGWYEIPSSSIDV